MISDLNQPAKHWLADISEQFGIALDNGDDPSIELKIAGFIIEIRLNRTPDGSFNRVMLPFTDEPGEES